MSRFGQALVRLTSSIALSGVALATAFAGGGTALAATCVPAGTTGFTAVKVATAGQTISGTIDATGCDMGVYVGPGVTNVTIRDATISGAARHGILVQNTGGVTITHNTVTNNAPGGETSDESKAIQLEGTNGVSVTQNTVTHNGGGGIAVLDDGSGTPDGLTASPVAAVGNVVSQNVVTDNSEGCGIVVAAYTPGAGVSGTVVVGNTVERNPAGIIVATDAPNTTASDNRVVNNTSEDNGLAGIIVHSNAPNDSVSGTTVVNNTVSGNGLPQPGFGILVATGAPSATLTGTSITGNRVCNETVAIAQSGDTGTRITAEKSC